MRGLDPLRAGQGRERLRDSARPRPPAARQRHSLDCAVEQPSAAGAHSADGLPRADSTRARTGAGRLAGPAASSWARGRGMASTRSKRSRSARESLSRKAASRCGEHEHSAAGSPRAPHGHRFIVATSWKRAGKTARPAARATADLAVLDRLAQRLERRALELGELVEHEDSPVRERHLARPDARARRRRSRPPTRCSAASGTGGA